MGLDPSSGTARDSAIVAIRVHNDCNILVTNPNDADPTKQCPDGSGVDSLTVTYSNNEAIGSLSGTRLLSSVATSDGDIHVSDSHQFAVNGDDFVVLWDTSSLVTDCTMLKVTGEAAGTPTGKLLEHTADGAYNPAIGDNIFPSGGYPQGALAVRFGPESAPRHFAIDTTSDPPSLVTWRSYNLDPRADRTDIELVADHIEDMQISAGCDGNGDGLIEEGVNDFQRRSDEWSDNVSSDTAPTCGTRNIAALRVTLIARAASPDLRKSGKFFRPGAEDRAAGTSADDLTATGQLGTYPRSNITTIIQTMNLR